MIELRDDPSFGALVGFGLAGVVGELLGDRAYRAAPLTTEDAATLIRAPRAAPMLDGYRGARRVDLAALEDLALRIGVLADAVPDIRSLVLDPVLAADRGAHPTGVTITLDPSPARSTPGRAACAERSAATVRGSIGAGPEAVNVRRGDRRPRVEALPSGGP